MDVYLEPKEAALLTGLLRHRLEELRREIHHTDSRAFKAELRTHEGLLESLLEKLRMPEPMGI